MTVAVPTAPDTTADTPILLDAYAARSCAVKTQNKFDAAVKHPAWEPDDALAELFDGGLAFENDVLDTWALLLGDRAADLRSLRGSPPSERVTACLAAMHAGTEVIIAGLLPPDYREHRVGSPDALVRAEDGPDGKPRYEPVEVKWHKITERRKPPRAGLVRPGSTERAIDPPASVACSTLTAPASRHAVTVPDIALRLSSREGDFLQLAHYHRMLEAVGFASGRPRGAIIGTDRAPEQPVLAWADLAAPLVRTFSRSQPEGWRLRSLIDRYDHEHRFRVRIAQTARENTSGDGPTGKAPSPRAVVFPIVVAECARCQWWEHCLPQLDPDDVSLRIDKGPLDVREIATLRRHGIATLTDLARTDLDELLAWYLPEVTHRSSAESRLRVAARRAEMLLQGEALHRETAGPIDVPAADVEIDLDIETSANGRIYLWGFEVHDAGAPARYVQFSRFADLDLGAEVALAGEALGWLRSQVERPESVLVYHYSSYEVTMITALADRAHDPVLDWAAEYAAEQFVDLLEIVQAHYFGVSGLGLKQVAKNAGFAWRDDDPGGLNSQRWFADAVHGEPADVRSQSRQRVLDYNEDDVRATARVRAWLRAS